MRKRRRQSLFYLLLFSTDSDTLGYVWVSLNSLRLRKWFGSQPSPASLARKRQTSEIRHLFHLADPVEGPRAYITKTNIRHFRGLHHKNGTKLVGFSCIYVLGSCSSAVLKRVCCKHKGFVQNHPVVAGLDNLNMRRNIKLDHK